MLNLETSARPFEEAIQFVPGVDPPVRAVARTRFSG